MIWFGHVSWTGSGEMYVLFGRKKLKEEGHLKHLEKDEMSLNIHIGLKD
jgi:hypothetical protein